MPQGAPAANREVFAVPEPIDNDKTFVGAPTSNKMFETAQAGKTPPNDALDCRQFDDDLGEWTTEGCITMELEGADGYRSRWPNLTLFVYPDFAEDKGVGAARFFVKRLATLVCLQSSFGHI